MRLEEVRDTTHDSRGLIEQGGKGAEAGFRPAYSWGHSVRLA